MDVGNPSITELWKVYPSSEGNRLKDSDSDTIWRGLVREGDVYFCFNSAVQFVTRLIGLDACSAVSITMKLWPSPETS